MEITTELIDVLRQSKKILTISHVSPDFDAIASQLAAKLALEKVGKKITTYNESGAYPNMTFLPGVEDVVTRLHPRARFDCTLLMDAGTPDRFGKVLNESPRERFGTLIKVDHHLTGSAFAEMEYVDPGRASTGELVMDLIKRYPIELDADIALNLYCAVVTDTGGFRYSNTNSAAFHTVAELLQHGVNPWDVTTRLYENRPEAELRLLSLVLKTLHVSHSGRYATLEMRCTDREAAGAEDYMTDGFINYARSLSGVEVAIFIREMIPDKQFKVSFRSKGTVNVATLAESLGGGGHHNAAGCTMKGSLTEVKAILYRIVDAKLPKSASSKKSVTAKRAVGKVKQAKR